MFPTVLGDSVVARDRKRPRVPSFIGCARDPRRCFAHGQHAPHPTRRRTEPHTAQTEQPYVGDRPRTLQFLGSEDLASFSTHSTTQLRWGIKRGFRKGELASPTDRSSRLGLHRTLWLRFPHPPIQAGCEPTIAAWAPLRGYHGSRVSVPYTGDLSAIPSDGALFPCFVEHRAFAPYTNGIQASRSCIVLAALSRASLRGASDRARGRLRALSDALAARPGLAPASLPACVARFRAADRGVALSRYPHPIQALTPPKARPD